MIRYTLIVSCLLMVAGCSTQQGPEMPRVDQSLMVSCPPMKPVPTAADGQVSMGDLLLADIELAEQLAACRKRNQALREWIKRVTGADN